jgi:prolyl-tRNA editing enzyme YbaK/EbsC (Cys-tRNA(Pro) deacylase)
MSIPKKIENFLKNSRVKYELVKHRTVYTARDKAATLKVPEKTIGKTLVLRVDRGYALVLIPANKLLDKNKLKKVAKVNSIDFVKEAWMKKNLKGIKIGAVPSFGGLFKMMTFAERSFLKNPRIVIGSGDYNWSIKIASGNFKKLVPDLIIGSFSTAKK